MVDHFRTLLLNLSYNNDRSEYIPKGFVAKTLPGELQEVYDLLFPKGLSRYYRLFLAHVYIKVLESANLYEDIKQFDPRLAYDATTSYFKLHRVSNSVYQSPATPTANDLKMSLIVTGKYTGSTNLNSFYEIIRITQTGTSNSFTVASVDGSDQVIKTYYTNLALSFDNQYGATSGYSTPVAIGTTGLSFAFNTSSTLASQSSGKVWKFIAESPISFNFNQLFDTLQTNQSALIKMFNKPASIDTSKYESLWTSYYNKIYKVAGLLLAYVARVDQFYKN